MDAKRKRWMKSLDLGDTILRNTYKVVIIGLEEEISLTAAGELLVWSTPLRFRSKVRKSLCQICIPGISYLQDKILKTSRFSSFCSAIYGDCSPLEL